MYVPNDHVVQLNSCMFWCVEVVAVHTILQMHMMHRVVASFYKTNLLSSVLHVLSLMYLRGGELYCMKPSIVLSLAHSTRRQEAAEAGERTLAKVMISFFQMFWILVRRSLRGCRRWGQGKSVWRRMCLQRFPWYAAHNRHSLDASGNNLTALSETEHTGEDKV